MKNRFLLINILVLVLIGCQSKYTKIEPFADYYSLKKHFKDSTIKKGAIEEYELKLSNSKETFIDFDTTDYNVKNARNYIIERSENVSFLVINENHWLSQHRSYLSSLLPELKKSGYNKLFLEGLINSVDDSLLIRINNCNLPVPSYGRLLRKAISLDFEIFAYDPINTSDSERDSIAATNILKNVNKNDKAIVLVGLDHIYESGYHPVLKKTVASHIRLKLDEDILTIDMVKFSNTQNLNSHPFILEDKSGNAKSFSNKDLRIMEDRIIYFENGESMTIAKTDTTIHKELKVDFSVFQPDAAIQNNRIQSISNTQNLIPITIDLTSIKDDISFPVKIYVYPENEKNCFKNIPFDYIEESEPNSKIQVMLESNKAYKAFINSNNGTFQTVVNK